MLPLNRDVRLARIPSRHPFSRIPQETTILQDNLAIGKQFRSEPVVDMARLVLFHLGYCTEQAIEGPPYSPPPRKHVQ